jgi:hypothetical protein
MRGALTDKPAGTVAIRGTRGVASKVLPHVEKRVERRREDGALHYAVVGGGQVVIIVPTKRRSQKKPCWNPGCRVENRTCLAGRVCAGIIEHNDFEWVDSAERESHILAMIASVALRGDTIGPEVWCALSIDQIMSRAERTGRL